MALTPTQQAQELILRSKRILVITKDHPDRDALAAAAALSLFLKKAGKQTDVVAPGIAPNEIPSFLPGREELKPSIGAMRAFHITLDVTRTPLGELMYDVKDGKLDITVVPKSGEWAQKDAIFQAGEDRYDLVIALGAPDLVSLGALAREHADFLYRTTILNVDCNATNEHWGQVNLVDLNAVAVCEILFGLFEQWNRHLIDERVATALLTGMVSRTKSFRTSNVTPKTLNAAAQLVAIGAHREEIMHGLWRTRGIPTLKLWGRALSRLEQDRELGLVWTVLARQDVIESGGADAQVEDVVDELVSYAPEAKVIALIYEKDGEPTPRVSLHAGMPFSAADLARVFGASGTREYANFPLREEKPLMEQVKTTIERLREAMRASTKR